MSILRLTLIAVAVMASAVPAGILFAVVTYPVIRVVALAMDVPVRARLF